MTNLVNAWLAGALIIFTFVISLFPTADSEIVSRITDGVAPFKSAIASANWFFPVDTFFAFLAIVFTIELGILTFKTIGWIAKNLSLGLFKT